MDPTSEHTLAGLSEKDVKQLAKRCPIVMTITEDILKERFEYTEELATGKADVLTDMKMDLRDAQVSQFKISNTALGVV